MDKPASAARLCVGWPHDHVMESLAVTREIRMGGHEVFEGRVDAVEMDIGDKAVYARIDARWRRAVDESAIWDEVGEDAKIGKAAPISRIRLISSDALKIIALKIIVPGQ
jgi:hypothetical protein